MTPKDQLDLCHKEYQVRFQDTESVYRRTSLILGGQVLIGGAVAALSNRAWLGYFGVRFDVSVYYLMIPAAIGLLIAALYFLVRAAHPRTYEVLATKELREWQCDYVDSLKEKGYSAEVAEQAAGSALQKAFLDRVCEATDRNLRVQQDRSAQLSWAYRLTVFSLLPLALMWLVHCWLSVKGI